MRGLKDVDSEAWLRLKRDALDPMAEQERREHWERAQAGDAEAADRLVRSHYRLVIAMASRYGRDGAPMNDLVSAGLLGIARALHDDGYDPARGQVDTYLASCARYQMFSFIHGERSHDEQDFTISRDGEEFERVLEDSTTKPDDNLLRAELRFTIADLVETKLPEQERCVMNHILHGTGKPKYQRGVYDEAKRRLRPHLVERGYAA